MAVDLALAALIRWLGLTALAGLIGGLAVDLVVLPRGALAVAPARERLRRSILLCVAVLILTTAGELVTRGQTMSGGGLAAAMAAIPAVVARTHFGAVWVFRSAALGLALFSACGRSRRARVLTLLLALGVALSTSLTGHAADRGDFSASVGMDWLHVTASAAWAGGLMGLGLVVLACSGGWPIDVVGAVATRFSRLAGWCLLAVALTGGYNAWVALPDVSSLWTTVYGRVLAVKLLLVLALVWWGAVNRYTIVPRLGPGRAGGVGVRLFRVARLLALGSARVARAAAPARLRAHVLREAVLAVLVFACTAVLVGSTPARHARHARHEAEPEPSPFRVSMDELHRQGGVPKGWTFVPPPGDAARGRQVFARHACFACHTVSGEPFPAATGAGPELAGVGAHHPAGYILESILNPNAVVVKGAGYTGPDGRSIMPDYRGQLSVSDLIDLVAYLKSR